MRRFSLPFELKMGEMVKRQLGVVSMISGSVV